MVKGRLDSPAESASARPLTSEALLEQPLLRIIIPAKNEAGRIRRTIVDYCEYFGARASVLVVANACSDETVEIVRRAATLYSQLQLIEILAGIGKGGAVRAGLTVGAEPFVAFVDADGSTKPAELDRLLEACSAPGRSAAIGSRWMRGSKVGEKQPFNRRIASRAFNLLVRLMFDLPFTDTQCGAKVFRRDAIDRVIDRLEIANFAFDVDVLFALKRLGLEIVEVPIVWDDSPDTKISLVRASTSMFAALVRLRLKHSPLRHLPFADLLARSSVIPVRRGLKALVLAHRDSDTQMVEAITQELVAQSHRAAVYHVDGWLNCIRFEWFYITHGHRHFDLIIDVTSDASARLLGFSTKPKIGREALLNAKYGDLSSLVSRVAHQCGYNAFFWRKRQQWILSGAGGSAFNAEDTLISAELPVRVRS